VAIGLAFAGSGIGNVVFPPIVNVMINSLGWRVTMRILSIPSIIIVISAFLLRQRVSMAPINLSSITEIGLDRVFTLLSVAGFLIGYGFLLPFVHIVTFAKSIGIGATKGAYLLCIMGGKVIQSRQTYLAAASAIGRIVLGVLSDKFGKVRVFTANMVIIPVTFIIWIYTKTFGGLTDWISLLISKRAYSRLFFYGIFLWIIYVAVACCVIRILSRH
jgi:nitrate/nitrite transporter NarK